MERLTKQKTMTTANMINSRFGGEINKGLKAKCKLCGEELLLIKTKAGAALPCDAAPVAYWKKAEANGRVITASGEIISCVFSGDIKTAGIGYIPHWKTCPCGLTE